MKVSSHLHVPATLHPHPVSALLNTAAVLSTISPSTSQEVPQGTNLVCSEIWNWWFQNTHSIKLVTQETSFLNANLKFGKTDSHDFQCFTVHFSIQ